MQPQILHGLAKIAMVLRQEAWVGSSSEGITPTQGQVLTLLATRDKEALGVSDVASHLAVTVPTASDAVRVLEQKGLLTKEPSAKDGRARMLRLSSRGKKLAERAAHWPDFLVSAVGQLSREEQAVFHVALIKMVGELQAQGRIPLARMCSNCSYFQANRYPGLAQAHHCQYIDGPIGREELRLDCEDFQAAPQPQREAAWREFLRIQPLLKE